MEVIIVLALIRTFQRYFRSRTVLKYFLKMTLTSRLPKIRWLQRLQLETLAHIWWTFSQYVCNHLFMWLLLMPIQ